MTTNKHILSNLKRNTYIYAVLLTIYNFRASAFLHNNFKPILITYKNPIQSTLLFSTSKEVDPLRKDKRASLHPVTINAISQALLEQSTEKLSSTLLEVANAAGRIVIDALEKRHIVEVCASDKQVKNLSQRKNETISRDHCTCDHVPEMSASEANDSLVRYKARSYLMAVKGLFRNA